MAIVRTLDGRDARGRLTADVAMAFRPLAMWWRDVAFFHYRADREVLARSLPRGVEVDVYDGGAWLSVVPFRMTDIHLRGLPVLPGFGAVPELNLRTYVRVAGRPGIWFYSLDATSPIVVEAARIVTALPYYRATIATDERAGTIRYEGERHDRRAVAGRFRASYEPSAAMRSAVAGTLDAFLHERYRFFSERGGRLLTAQVHHPAWSLQSLNVEVAENTLGAIAGADLNAPPDLATFGRGVPVTASLTVRA